MNSEKIKVLDHGFIRYIDHMGSDLSIVRNARVSYDAEWRAGQNKGSDEKLIHYLYANGHNTPFESCVVTFEVKAPLFVFRQWHRHRTQSFNELSARYRELPEEYYIPELIQITMQSDDNKQMRTEEQNPNAKDIQSILKLNNKLAFANYKGMLDLGCPRELARSALPVGTYSHMFATANLHNWFRFLSERLHPHAQYEIRVFAEQILAQLAELFPVATAAFEKDQKRKAIIASIGDITKMTIQEWARVTGQSPEQFKQEIISTMAALGSMDMDKAGNEFSGTVYRIGEDSNVYDVTVKKVEE